MPDTVFGSLHVFLILLLWKASEKTLLGAKAGEHNDQH